MLMRTQASSMRAIRRGKQPDAKDNPATIFISIPEHSTEDWPAIRDQVVDVLDGANLASVAVEVSRGTSALQVGTGRGRNVPDEV